MRKPDKASLYHDLTCGLTNAEKPASLPCIIHRGCLLHKVHWSASMNVSDGLELFVNSIAGFGITVSVVFDGHGSRPSIEDREHIRRSLTAGQVVPDPD